MGQKIQMKLTDRMGFGKYQNDTVQTVLTKDTSYITWALDKIPWFDLDREAKQIYDVLKKEV